MAAIPIRDEPIAGKPGLSPLDGGGPKLIVHTTEVGKEVEDNGAPGLIQRCRNRDLTAFAAIYNGVLATWKRGAGYPTQYLVDAPNRVAARCVPDHLGSYALEDLADQWNFYGATLGPIIDVDPARISPCVCIGPTPEGVIPTGTWPFHRVLSGTAHSHPELAGVNHVHTNLAAATHTHPAQPPATHTHAELAPATHVHTVPAHTHPPQPAAPHTHPLTGNTAPSA